MIQWYPGHMKKAFRLIEENLPLIDALVYVLDARAPKSCFNPDFNAFIGRLPVIYALNKADMADRSEVKRWTGYLSGKESVAFALTATASKTAQPILSAAEKLCHEKLEKYRKKGVSASVRLMVLGVPNTGKSTIINNLCGSAKTATANRPGVTRGKQWVRVGERFEVLDTPGTLYPKLSDQTVARHLAYLGSIRDEVTDSPELATSLLEELYELVPNALSVRYKLDLDAAPTLAQVAKARGLLLRGGIPDDERAATAVLDDFRKGRFGAITLDKAPLPQADENPILSSESEADSQELTHAAQPSEQQINQSAAESEPTAKKAERV